jgi:hypothetical protein
MHAYRFLIKFEEQSDFSREIDVLANQTFEDFYSSLASNLKLEDNQWVVFYICDHNFKKKTELPKEEAFATKKTLKPLDDDEVNFSEQKIVLMKDAYLNEYIDDPHQRLIILFDKVSQWTFYVEMTKIIPVQEKLDYPIFRKIEGDTPRELLPIAVIPVDPEEDDSELIEDDGNDLDDTAFYNNEEIEEMQTEDSGAPDVEEEQQESEIEEVDFSNEDFSGDFDEEKF